MLVTAGLLLAVFGLTYSVKGPCATTSLGTVCGLEEQVLGKSISIFYGIPYAEPPIGHLRFKSPEPSQVWKDEIDGTRAGAVCHQVNVPKEAKSESVTFFGAGEQEASEDCLYLNIFAPSGSKNLPVMVWIHGGGFWFGAGSTRLYDGRVFASVTNTVMVTLNYRLGLFGFGYLGVPGMQGNMGLLDQREALRWIQNNIKEFGGNPDMITIFGESAGAASVAAHILAPGSQSLFSAAVAESGSVFDPWASNDRYKSVERTKSMAKELGCGGEVNDILDCLMKTDAGDLAGVNPFGVMQEACPTVIDNDKLFFGKSMEDLLNKGDFSLKAYIIGTNVNEGKLMLWFNNPVQFPMDSEWTLDRDEYEKMAAAMLRGRIADRLIPKVISYYSNPVKYGTPLKSLEELSTDFSFFYGSRKLIGGLSRTSKKVHAYLFNVTSSGLPKVFPKQLGSTHATELPFVFGLPQVMDTYKQEEKELSRDIMNKWASLGTKGKLFDPSWPSVEPSKPMTIKLLSITGPDTLTDYKKDEIPFWESIYQETKDGEGKEEL